MNSANNEDTQQSAIKQYFVTAQQVLKRNPNSISADKFHDLRIRYVFKAEITICASRGTTHSDICRQKAAGARTTHKKNGRLLSPNEPFTSFLLIYCPPLNQEAPVISPPRFTISRRSGIKPYGHRLAPYRSAQGFEPYSRFAPHQAHNLSRVSCRRRSS